MTQRATDRLAIDGGAPVRAEPLHPDKGMAYIDAEEREAVLRVLDSRSLFRYYGPDLQNAVRSLELGFAEKMGVPYAVAVSSGTAALRTALAAIGVSEGDEVIIPAVTFIATVGAVVAQRAVPMFAEVDASLTLDPADFEAKISPRTRAVIPVHLGNVPCHMDEIMAAARRHGITVIEDVAQAVGASYKGRRLGSIGDLGAFSLQLEKNITSGEGGIVTTNSYELFDRVTRFQDQGGQFRIQSGEVRETTEGEAFVGENLRMAELAGAVAGVQLRRLDGMLDAMRSNKRRVKHLLSDLPGIEFREIPDPEGDGGSGITFFVDTEERAKRMVQALRAEGVPAGQVYGGLPVYANPQILNKRTAWNGCPWHCEAHPTTVEYYIGLGPRYTEQDCQDIVLAVRKVAKHLL